MKADARIFVAGHLGLVGGAVHRALTRKGFSNVVGRSRAELDLEDEPAVLAFFERERPEYVILAAAKVGGIHANNTYPVDFVRTNLRIQLSVIEAAWRTGVTKLLFLGSSCIYPKLADQPISEDALLGGPLEPTNRPYAIAKIAGIELCRSYNRQYGTNFIAAMPTNLYGPGDNFDLQNAHVLPALMHRFHLAKITGEPSVTVWGSGTPRREFLYVDDVAEACVFLMERYDGEGIVNIGCGEDVSIAEVADAVRAIVGFRGEIAFDRSKPDGTPGKLLDVSKLRDMGWRPATGLREGLERTYRWFLDNKMQVGA
ncbi:MAG: GDP-L-fucose synthase [Gemmatimonadaceae bacterium]|nr:GDP-L-fucose synthase [Gemmatimonadaceae bacterium]